MRSVKIVIMVTAVGITRQFSLPITNENNRFPNFSAHQPSDLPSANSLAKAVLNTENPISVVFNNLSEKYHLPVSNLPSSLSGSFEVLKNISEVLSSLPDPEKSNVQLQLKDAFRSFYLQYLNLPEAVSSKAANRIAKALIHGPDALEKLERAVNKIPQAVEFGENVLAFLKSQDSNNQVVAKKPTLAKQTSDSGRKKTDHSLHNSNPV
ncbi:hypothetical protein E3A20_15400 [Planctomyces bekefii]|uniref:Uncharacterized protein n=1 Tax=Planctomyces bekefii TaxID=1653850 RepID=A0A5C6M568_9PLAN|nr:hypothetical protein E3A20_15400 [Planctomyces bekefii]